MEVILPPLGGPVASEISGYSIPTSTDLPSASSKSLQELKTAFVKFMEDEWKKRVEVVEALQELKSKVRVNRLQCSSIIDIYSTLEVLTLHPENYLDIIDHEDPKAPKSFETLDEAAKVPYTKSLLDPCFSSLRASFLELNRIMRHGEILVRECACEDWISGALTKMTTTSKNDWSIVTPLSLHVQKLQWILDVIGKGIEELESLALQNSESLNPSDENEFKKSRILPPETDVDKNDIQLLLNDLLEYLNEPSSGENESEEKQLARFVVWRLQNNSLRLADSQSSESSDVTLNPICETERFARNQMVPIGLLGSGSQSKAVFRKKWLGIEVAVKELEGDSADFANEIKFAGLHHPHVVRVFDHWIGQEPNIVMELMDEDLKSFMKTKFKDGCPPFSWAIDLMHQLAEAMKYLWDNNITHRDLKSLNLLVRRCPCDDDEACIIIKLADFGTSKISSKFCNLSTVRGTRLWMAPEVSKSGYTFAADVYSFAITCSEILTGKLPFHDKDMKGSTKEVKKRIKEGLRPTLPEDCPIILSAYLQRCWATNPEERPKHFAEICEFLLYCKEMMLRDGRSSRLPSINDNDANVLLAHLGIKWCLAKDKDTRNLIHISSAVHKRIMLAIHSGTPKDEIYNDTARKEIEDVTDTERLEAAYFFGEMTGHGQQDRYEKAPSTSARDLVGLVVASMISLLSSVDKEGKIKLLATYGRLLVLFFLVSPKGLPALLEYRPTFLLLGLKADFLFYALIFFVFVSIVYEAKVTGQGEPTAWFVHPWIVVVDEWMSSRGINPRLPLSCTTRAYLYHLVD